VERHAMTVRIKPNAVQVDVVQNAQQPRIERLGWIIRAEVLERARESGLRQVPRVVLVARQAISKVIRFLAPQPDQLREGLGPSKRTVRRAQRRLPRPILL